MSIYILPAILALVIKLLILGVSVKGKHQSTVFITMVLILALHNLCEVLGFLEFFESGPKEYLLRLYYATTVWVAAFMLIYSSEVSRLKHGHFRAVLMSIAGVVSLLMLYTNWIVAGAESLGYTMTVVQGEQYWIFRIFVLATLLAIIPVIVVGYRRATEHIVEIQSIYTMFALAPLMLVGISVIVLMSLGVRVNASAFIPIASTLFLLITLKSEYRHNLTDVRRFIPFSAERRAANQIMDICSRYSRDKMSYRDGINEIEKILVLQKYQKEGGNASATAESMGMPRSSLYSIFNRLNIDTKD
ncbi:hypothetical protein [Arenicella xantha]|uniref:Regulatory Fis family protein n=1 Tax=Arenicella xantha TaxID=644221 RepID=A0A395JKY3_9GAMM|nr:hypothetical protein [Arenicella xantha]RBP51456.1 hypothetical protein DFR28_102885 [Arenicella xantha]